MGTCGASDERFADVTPMSRNRPEGTNGDTAEKLPKVIVASPPMTAVIAELPPPGG